MTGGMSASKSGDGSELDGRNAPAAVPVVSVAAETLARLERLATASLLATGFAHEIANPLSCLIAALDALETRVERLRRGTDAAAGIDVDELASDVELASVSGNEMFTLVRDFQLFLRPQGLETAPPIDLKPAIVRALRMARARLGGTSPVSVTLSDAPHVRIQSSRVTQIVLNLLLNAADAMVGRPWSANLIEVRLDRVEHWAVIEVKDNGPGIDVETRRHLFEPGTSTKRDGVSMGLGLAISRELARAAGGDITVSCPPSAGTLFRIVLPPAMSAAGEQPSTM